jgi:hypothetical protein
MEKEENKIEMAFEYLYNGEWISFELIKEIMKRKESKERIRKHLLIIF